MSDTQIIVALALGVFAFVIFGSLILIVVVRLRRVVRSQLQTLDNLVSTLQAARQRDTPEEPRSK